MFAILARGPNGSTVAVVVRSAGGFSLKTFAAEHASVLKLLGFIMLNVEATNGQARIIGKWKGLPFDQVVVIKCLLAVVTIQSGSANAADTIAAHVC